MGKAKTIISGMVWTIIQNVVKILYGFIAIPFLINFYGKEEYGLIGLAMSVNAYVTLLDMGMTNSNVRFFSEFIAKGDQERIQRLFSLTHLFYLVLGFLNTVLLVIASLFVDSFFKVTPEQAITLRNLLWILALNATFSWISICYDQFLKANELIDWIKKRATLLRILLFAVLFCSIQFKWPIEWYFVGFIFMGTVILPLTLIKARRIMPTIKMNFRFDKEMFRTILPYALSIFSFSIFGFVVTSSRPLFLGNLIGPGAVAEFNIIMAIINVIGVFTSSIMQVLLPILTKMRVNSDDVGVQSLLMVGTKYITIFLTVLVLGIAISSSELLTVYVGKDYVCLKILLVVSLLTQLLSHRNVMTTLVFTERKLTSVAMMCSVAMVVALTLYAIFVPRYGVGGVVIGFTFHELIHILFYYLYFLPKRLKINTRQIFLRSVLPSWLLLGSLSIAVYYGFSFFDEVWTSLLVKSLVFGILSLCLICTIILNKDDKMILQRILKKQH